MTSGTLKVAVPSLLSCMSLLIPSAVSAQQVKLEDVAFKDVLGRLFGTDPTSGPPDRVGRFQFLADGVVLNSHQIALLFPPTGKITSDVADLLPDAEQIQGAELRIRGLLDDAPFDFELSGNQIMLGGVSLTQAELEALIDELRGIAGLHKAKIQAIVDGNPLVVQLENVAGA